MIYLDHAATSRPKAPGVAAAIARWFEDVGVSADRGDSTLCEAARGPVDRCRARVAALCGVSADRIAFTSGATESLHLLLRALLHDGDAVLTTRTEHSSVVRPLVVRRQDGHGTFDVVDCDAAGHVDPDDVAHALRSAPAGGYRALVFNHASNVTGAVQDARALCDLAREHGVLSIVDQSQTAGVLPLDVGADAAVFGAHKALLGPPGLGMLMLRPGIEPAPPKPGGSGSSTALEFHPDRMPRSFEAGTPNTPAIHGLDAALCWHEDQGAAETGKDQPPAARLTRSLEQLDAAIDAIRERVPGVHVHHPDQHRPRLPVVSLTFDDLDPTEAGMLLAAEDIHVRSGHHCAPWVHERLGTAETGTLRISPGPFITAAELSALPPALAV